MADIINSVDRSLDMYIYDLYIYIYIDISLYLSIYLSVYLSLSILVGRHLCQRGASRQQKPTSCRYDAYKAFKFIAWCKAAPHNLRLSSFFALAAHGRKVRKPAVPGSTPGKKKQYRLYTLCPCCVSPTMRCGRLPSRSDVNTLQTEVLIGNIYIYIYTYSKWKISRCHV